MKIKSVLKLVVCSTALWIALAAGVHAADTVVPGWDPNAFRTESTLEIMTTGPGDEGEHWSKLWLAVIDGKLYVRLGDRSYGRIQKNTTAPYLKVKVAGREFDKVRLDETPDMKDKVAAAMADKYFMDILIRHESHPMTARLTAESAPALAPSR
jgi:hypothetical protein